MKIDGYSLLDSFVSYLIEKGVSPAAVGRIEEKKK
jgi:hypothetical protein